MEEVKEKTDAGIKITIPIPFEKTLEKLIGPAAEEIGQILKNTITPWRIKNFVNSIRKAEKILNDKGINPGQIPLNEFYPLLEKSSLTDDECLQDKWANLLANAADSNNKSPLILSISEVLSQLTSKDAKFLENIIEKRILFKGTLFGISQQNGIGTMTHTTWYDWLINLHGPQPSKIGLIIDKKNKDIMEIFCDLTEAEIENLKRLNIIQYENINEMDLVNIGWTKGLKFTEFGKVFMKMCTSRKI